MKVLTLADFLHIKTNSTHYAAAMWCIKSTVVVVNFILDRPKEIWLLGLMTTTRQAISTSNDTDVTKHLRQNSDHNIDFNDPIVLSHASNWRKLLIKETLFH